VHLIAKAFRGHPDRSRLRPATSRLAAFNFFDWLGIFSADIQRWRLQDFSVARIELDAACDPVSYRIQVSFRDSATGRLIAGYGEAGSEHLAYEKALSELVEREAVLSNGMRFGIHSTNGVACHRLRFLAKEAARLELLERDAFLRHWLTRTPLRVATIPPGRDFLCFSQSFDARGHDLVLCETSLGYLPTSIAVVVNRETGGFLLGSSAASGEKIRHAKAIGEAFSILFGRDDWAVNWQKPDFKDHSNYWYRERVVPSWLLGPSNRLIRKPNKKPQINYVDLRNDRLSVVAARSPDVLDIWVGPTPDEVVHRAAGFFGMPINEDIHPFP
jgi:hypothetical protein